MKLILASSSPRRAEILRQAGLAFEARAPHVDESRQPDETASDYVQRVARAKAGAAARSAQGPEIIIAADTVVLIDGLILGKPASREEARTMLRRLAGRTHEVLTGLAVLRLPDGKESHAEERTLLTLAVLSEDEIDAYLATGEPLDKAGAYAIQGRGARFVTRVEGNYFNVVGLPLARLCVILKELGWQDS
ncbi:MAG: Maf family protein [Candidatus Acidiferrales bacterium]